jgi:hypothetical protein
MFKYLKIKTAPHKVAPDPGVLPAYQLLDYPNTPIAIRNINNLAENAKRRIYRNLIPPGLLAQFDIDPISWQGPTGQSHVRLIAEPNTGSMHIGAQLPADSPDEFFTIELHDNGINGIDLNLLLLNDPNRPRFNIDYSDDGHPTMLGTARRNVTEEARAMQAGLAPAQIRSGLGVSKVVLQQVENFLTTLSHYAFFLEPLTYASAWLFERRGFAYVRGHKLMDDIQREFQSGGKLSYTLRWMAARHSGSRLSGAPCAVGPGQFTLAYLKSWVHPGTNCA